MPKMGLVLQGGGALGAYEYGAVTRLVELKQFPAYLNRWDSQQARNEGVFAH
jgi:hypothetical protein